MSAYYECAEHRFYVAGAPDPDGGDWYIDEQIAEHEREHAEAARERGEQPAIALDGDDIVFGVVSRDGLHRKVVEHDLGHLAEVVGLYLDEHQEAPTGASRELLRNVRDVADALQDALAHVEAAAADQEQSLVELGERTIAVVRDLVAVLLPAVPLDLRERVLSAVRGAPQTLAEIAETLDVKPVRIADDVIDLVDTGRLHCLPGYRYAVTP